VQDTAQRLDRIKTFQKRVVETGTIPLSWVATTAHHPHANLGDALSALVVSTISGLPVEHRHFYDSGERLIGIGTIGQAQRNGILHFWGTGMTRTNPGKHPYSKPPNTELIVHALRGKMSAAVMRKSGIHAPDVFGDPAWFLPRFFPRTEEPKFELGVILHISELDVPIIEGEPKKGLEKYKIPPALSGAIRIINTYASPTLEGLHERVNDILSCKRIVSTSFHGLVIAEAYGIPCALLPGYDGHETVLSVGDEKARLDHRVRDFYSATEQQRVVAYCADPKSKTDWDRVIRWIDSAWEPAGYDGRLLLESFPCPRRVDFSEMRWSLPESAYRIRF
jgi:hypothetical protein